MLSWRRWSVPRVGNKISTKARSNKAIQATTIEILIKEWLLRSSSTKHTYLLVIRLWGGCTELQLHFNHPRHIKKPWRENKNYPYSRREKKRKVLFDIFASMKWKCLARTSSAYNNEKTWNALSSILNTNSHIPLYLYFIVDPWT